MNRQKVKELREQISAHLQELEIEGINIKLGNASFDETSVRIRLELSEVREDGLAMDEDAATYQALAEQYGMDPEWLGQTFVTTWTGEEYTLIGLRTRSRKYPIIATKEGKKYKLTIESVKAAFLKERE